MAMLDCANPVFRLPYYPYDAELRAEGAKLLKEIGLENCAKNTLKEIKDEDFILLDSW